MRMSLRLRSALLAAAAATTVIPLTATPASAIECYDTTSGGATWYNGDSASYRYDNRFSGGPVPATEQTLEDYVPQGLGTWRNWNGTGSDLLVYTAYSRNGGRAVVQGVDTRTGTRTHKAFVPAGHVGGIAFARGWAWIASDGYIDRYNLNVLRNIFQGDANDALINPGLHRDVYGASFLSEHDGHLFAGRFSEDSRATGYRYRIEDNGTLTTLNDFEVPKKAQGLAVTDGHFLWSTSYGRNNRSNIYVVERGRSIDSGSCFRAPTMSEGATLYDGRFWLIYESGSQEFNGVFDDPTNIITRLHKAPVSDLTSLLS